MKFIAWQCGEFWLVPALFLWPATVVMEDGEVIERVTFWLCFGVGRK